MPDDNYTYVYYHQAQFFGQIQKEKNNLIELQYEFDFIKN